MSCGINLVTADRTYGSASWIRLPREPKRSGSASPKRVQKEWIRLPKTSPKGMDPPPSCGLLWPTKIIKFHKAWREVRLEVCNCVHKNIHFAAGIMKKLGCRRPVGLPAPPHFPLPAPCGSTPPRLKLTLRGLSADSPRLSAALSVPPGTKTTLFETRSAYHFDVQKLDFHSC